MTERGGTALVPAANGRTQDVVMFPHKHLPEWMFMSMEWGKRSQIADGTPRNTRIQPLNPLGDGVAVYRVNPIERKP